MNFVFLSLSDDFKTGTVPGICLLLLYGIQRFLINIQGTMHEH